MLVVLAPIITVGAINESREVADTAAAAGAQATQTPIASAPAPAPASSELPTPPPAVEPSDSQDEEEPGEYDETHLQFGQTAHFTTSAGGSSTPLEFTVSAPIRFKLSEDAILFEAGSLVTMKGKRQPTNVYFTVTVKNSSASEPWDNSFLFSSVTETGDDDVVSVVYDGDIEGVGDLNGGKDLRPGKSATAKDGFSVVSADHIQYELDVDGLAGQSFYWTE